MNKASRVRLKRKDDRWYVMDPVPVGERPVLTKIEFMGLGEPYVHRYKNGEEEERWRIIDSIGPKDEVWFILKATLDNTLSNYNMAVRIGNNQKWDTICFEWLTEKNMRISYSVLCPSELCKMDVAMIEAELNDALGNV
jgi:hypothetical protein